jgi:5-methylcytosine-specific restriction endonuclease McrA
MKQKLKTFIISVLRKSTFKWKPRQKAYDAAKVQVGTYSTGRPKYKRKCAVCENLFLSKDIQMDHIDPVVPLDGYKSGMKFDLNEYAERMFPEEEGWSCICRGCHDKKTAEEDKLRKLNKKVDNKVKQ